MSEKRTPAGRAPSVRRARVSKAHVETTKGAVAEPARASSSRVRKSGKNAAKGAWGVPEIAAVLIDARRKDVDALKQAGQLSYAGIRAVVRRQVELLKEALGEWQLVVKVMRMAGPQESIARLDDLGRGAMLLALAGIRELAELAIKEQTRAAEVVKRRIDEDLAEIDKLLRKPAGRVSQGGRTAK